MAPVQTDLVPDARDAFVHSPIVFGRVRSVKRARVPGIVKNPQESLRIFEHHLLFPRMLAMLVADLRHRCGHVASHLIESREESQSIFKNRKSTAKTFIIQ